MRLLLSILFLVAPLFAGNATVRIHYPDTSVDMFVRGESPLSWSSGQRASRQGQTWTFSVNISGRTELKPLIDDREWSKGANFVVYPGDNLDIFPFFRSSQGSLEIERNFHAPQLGNSRSLRIYLPPSYHENTLKHYPVVYAQDGQNLFEDATSFGGEWRIDENLDGGVESGFLAEMIVVGVDNTYARMSEYTPTTDPRYGGGDAADYLAFLRDTVKPFIDQSYRTLPGARHTAVLGSSLGGLFAFYAGWTEPDVFGNVLAMSSSFWWDNEVVLQSLQPGTPRRDIAIYLDSGDAGPSKDGAAQTMAVRDALNALGYQFGTDLSHWLERGADHSEAAWSARVFRPLRALSTIGGFPDR